MRDQGAVEPASVLLLNRQFQLWQGLQISALSNIVKLELMRSELCNHYGAFLNLDICLSITSPGIPNPSR